MEAAETVYMLALHPFILIIMIMIILPPHASQEAWMVKRTP